MSYLFDGIDDVLTLASAPATAAPMTFAAWFKTSDATNNQSLVSIGVTGSGNNRFTLMAQGAVAGDPIRGTTATTTTASVDSTTGYSTGSWQHGCVVFASITDRRAFVNGGSKGTNATSRNPAGVGETLIGFLHNATSPMNGRIAEVCIWSVALSDAEVASIAISGTNPSTVQSGNVLAYWKLRADANDSSGNGRHLTVTGATLDADNPWAVGTFVALAGDVSGAGAPTGDLKTLVPLAGGVAGAGAQAGDLTTAATSFQELAGNVAGAAAQTGALIPLTPLAGGVAGVGVQTGNLTTVTPLAGGVAGAGAQTGRLSGTMALGGAVQGSSGLSGNLTGTLITAQTNMPAGTWRPGSTVRVYDWPGDAPNVGTRGTRVVLLATAPAAADGSLVVGVSADPDEPLLAEGVAPSGEARLILTFAV